MLAVYESYRAGLLKRTNWLANLSSGVIVGVVALPLAMAFAIASGVKPEQGIYTSIFAGIIVSLIGGSRIQIAGPTGAFIVILAGIVNQYGITGLQIATMMAGAILLVLGFTKLGGIIRFIPTPVIIGFTSGIGVIIWVGQWRDFFGLPAVEGEHFHQKLLFLVQHFSNLNMATTALACLCLVLVIVGPKIPGLKKVPGPLLALVVATFIQYVVASPDIRTIGTAFGGIPQGLPEFDVPNISLPELVPLIGPAFAIAMLGAIESLLSAVVADGMAGTKHDSNQELIGQGIANMISPLFGGIAATGAIARTATNIRNGGNSPISGVVHAITLIVILLVLAPLAVNIPLAALSAILFVVAWNMSEARHFYKLVRTAPIADVVILITTFLLTVFSDLVVAVNIGVIIAILHFVRRMATSVEMKQDQSSELASELQKYGLTFMPKELFVFAVDGPFFFGTSDLLERSITELQSAPQTILIRLKWVPFMDITGLQALEKMILTMHQQGISICISGANERVNHKLHRAGIIHLIGEHHYFQDVSQAFSQLLYPNDLKM
ncbi:SulP family inorganic anion transporter [Vibrio nitrifigilis]|uniref:STAS domain-containing protein n=1 Tax=Vibrio nitrifigilis TaxID=2789781 RepID=A0ABS0GM00_9VIBR|nr:SulP family inorganic anion transporter [Vibrio nitrifigilis]MBF9003497.1 STAS domain-containing protein [Vibrio nitrifigilis]